MVDVEQQCVCVYLQSVQLNALNLCRMACDLKIILILHADSQNKTGMNSVLKHSDAEGDFGNGELLSVYL